jgi:hypothetical protein
VSRHLDSHHLPRFASDDRRQKKRVTDSKKVAAIRKLFCDTVFKQRPGLLENSSDQACRFAAAVALQSDPEFDTNCDGVIDHNEFGVMISKVLALRLSSDVEELLWSSCCKHETFAEWMVAMVGDITEEPPADEEPDSRPQRTEPQTKEHGWGGRCGVVQNDPKARPEKLAENGDPAVGRGARPRPRSEWPQRCLTSVSTTTVNPVQSSTGRPPPPTRASPKLASPATAPMHTRRLSPHAHTRASLQRARAGGSAGNSPTGTSPTAVSSFFGTGGTSGMSEAAKQYLLNMSCTPIQTKRPLQAGKLAPARLLTAVEHIARVTPARAWRRRQQPDADAAEAHKRQQVVTVQQAPQMAAASSVSPPAVNWNTTVNLTAQLTDPLQNGTGRLPAAPVWASPKTTPPASATAPMRTRRLASLDADATNPNSEHSPGAGAGRGQGRAQGSDADATADATAVHKRQHVW